MRNVRKLKINANVTFSIWMLEWIAFITCVICWAMVSSAKVDIFLEFVVLWTYVILPHTFLMNTAHNKDRIIDNGFKSTLKNALALPFDIKLLTDKLSQRREGGCSSAESIDSKSGNGSIEKESPKPLNHGIEKNETSTPGIFIISKDGSTQQNENSENRTGFALKDFPSTSNGVYKEAGLNWAQIIQNSRHDSEPEIDEVSLQNANRMDIGQKLLSYMYQNIDNEKLYLHYLIQLTEYEREQKEENCNKNSFNVITVADYEMARTKKRQKSKGRNKASKEGKLKVKSHSRLISSPIEMTLANRTSEKKLEISQIRKLLLDNYDEYCKIAETYEQFLTRLFDFEEELMNE